MYSLEPDIPSKSDIKNQLMPVFSIGTLAISSFAVALDLKTYFDILHVLYFL
jgi:hypothetical protein